MAAVGEGQVHAVGGRDLGAHGLDAADIQVGDRADLLSGLGELPDGVMQLLIVGGDGLTIYAVTSLELVSGFVGRFLPQDEAGEFGRRLVEVDHLGGIDEQHAMTILLDAQV